jgi:polar amino acid transport system substrate-binding protein
MDNASAKTFIFLSLFSLFTCCDFPKDPGDSFEEAGKGHLLVGIIENKPWIWFDNDTPAGIEAEIIEEFAARNRLEIEWIKGPPDALIILLKNRDLHIVAGGFTDKSKPWNKEAGMTRPYRKEKIVVAYSDTLPSPSVMKNLAVCYSTEHPFAKWIRKKGGKAVFGDVNACGGYYAVYESESLPPGVIKAPIVLHLEKHVIAVAPGENSLLSQLEKVLQDYRKP